MELSAKPEAEWSRFLLTKGGLRLLSEQELRTLKQIAAGVAAQFGSNCEVVIHLLDDDSASHSIAAIYNGHVTGRKVGDGPSHIVLEQRGRADEDPKDQISYLMRTSDGKILKSSSFYIRDSEGRVSAIFCINFDVSALTLVKGALAELVDPKDETRREPERIAPSVQDLLDDLIRQSVELVGKPVALMNPDDKVRAVQFLNNSGALRSTKSGDNIAKFFGISKYTLYSYLDMKAGGESK